MILTLELDQDLELFSNKVPNFESWTSKAFLRENGTHFQPYLLSIQSEGYS